MDNPTVSRPVNFIRFHGLNLLVVEFEGVEYVAAQPLTDLAGMQWKGAKHTLTEPENVNLYGTRRIPEPEIAGSRVLKYPQKAEAGSAGTPRSGLLCIRLDRARMFLARINTARMRGNDNADAADRLLALQIEWAKVLHDYETNGYAVKPGALRDLQGLIKAAALTTRPGLRASLNTMIDDTCAAMGYPIHPDPQQQLPL